MKLLNKTLQKLDPNQMSKCSKNHETECYITNQNNAANCHINQIFEMSFSAHVKEQKFSIQKCDSDIGLTEDTN